MKFKFKIQIVAGLILLIVVSLISLWTSSPEVALAAALGVSIPPRNRNGQQVQSQQVPSRNLQIPGMRHVFTNPQLLASANIFPIPDNFTLNVVSAAGVGALPTRVFVLNQDTLFDIDDNGSAPGSITYAYTDQFAGRLVSRLLSQDRAGVGAACFGAVIRMVVTATGAGDPAGLAQTNPYFQFNNAFGTSITTNMNMSSNQTRMDQDTSIEVVPLVANLGAWVQYSFVMPVADTASVTFYLSPNYPI